MNRNWLMVMVVSFSWGTAALFAADDEPKPRARPGAGQNARRMSPAQMLSRFDKNNDGCLQRDECPPRMQEQFAQFDQRVKLGVGDNALLQSPAFEFDEHRERLRHKFLRIGVSLKIESDFPGLIQRCVAEKFQPDFFDAHFGMSRTGSDAAFTLGSNLGEKMFVQCFAGYRQRKIAHGLVEGRQQLVVPAQQRIEVAAFGGDECAVDIPENNLV